MSTITTTIDDLDGSRPARKVTFSLDGKVYMIDLSRHNEDQLRDILSEYIRHARNVTQSVSGYQRRDDMWTVRRWAFDQGYDVPTKGRLGSYWFNLYDNRKTFVPSS